MLDLLKVAVRNVGRNKRRTIITIITVFIGVVVVISTRGLLNGLQGEIRSGLTRKVNGDLQIHMRGYQDSLESSPYKMMLPYSPESIDAIKAIEGVEEVAPRMRIMALLNHQKSQTSTPVLLSAIDSKFELVVCPRLMQAVQVGSMLDSRLEMATQAVSDENLEAAVGLDEMGSGAAGSKEAVKESPKATGYHQIMVTPSLMRGMNAKIGDEIVLLVQDKNSMQQALVAVITGVVDYGLPNVSARMAWVDFTTLQKTVGAGGMASELAISTKPHVDENIVRRKIEPILPKDQIVETWLELAGFFRDVMSLQNTIFSVVLIIVFTIMISAIVNTSLMTVMERTREIGTLMALGYRRNHILLLFLGESAVIGFGGGIIGLSAALAIVKVLGTVGVDMTIPGAAVPTVLYPWVGGSFIGLVLGLATAAALIAGFLPAYRASRMKPVEALATS